MTRSLVIVLFFISNGVAVNFMKKLSLSDYTRTMDRCGVGSKDQWAVTIQSGRMKCSGARITPYHILTLAKCFFGRNDTHTFQNASMQFNVTVPVRCNGKTEAERKRTCTTVVRPRHFVVSRSAADRRHNIAIIELGTFSDDADPELACVPLKMDLPINTKLRMMNTVPGDGNHSVGGFPLREIKQDHLLTFDTNISDWEAIPGDPLYTKIGPRQELIGLALFANESRALSVGSWSDFLCSQIKYCRRNYSDVPIPEPFIIDRFKHDDGLDVIGEETYARLTKRKQPCTHEYRMARLAEVTRMGRYSEDQYALINKHCGYEIPDKQSATATRTRRMTNGRYFAFRTHPYVVAVIVTTKSEIFGTCTGTLISPKHVITSANCMLQLSGRRENKLSNLWRKYEEDRVYIQYGSLCMIPEIHTNNGKELYQLYMQCRRTPDAKFIKVFSMMGPYCENRQCEDVHDAAILLLSEPIPLDSPYARPICLPRTDQILPKHATLVGFGRESKEYLHKAIVVKPNENPTIPKLLTLMRLGTADNRKNVRSFALNNITYTSFEPCTSIGCQMLLKTGNSTVQFYDQQDFGGPLLVKMDNRSYLVGVLSKMYFEPKAGYHALFHKTTATNVTGMLGFICLYTGICPDGPDVHDPRTQPLFSPTLVSMHTDAYLEDRARASATGVSPRIVVDVKDYQRWNEALVKQRRTEYPTLRKKFSIEEYAEIERTCGEPHTGGPRARIHGGKPEMRYHGFAVIFHKQDIEPNFLHYFLKEEKFDLRCSGAFISPFHVLTAAQCLYRRNKNGISEEPVDASYLQVGYGSECFESHGHHLFFGTFKMFQSQFRGPEYCLTTTQKFVDVRHIIAWKQEYLRQRKRNEQTRKAFNDADIAILELKERVDSNGHFCLPKKSHKYKSIHHQLGAGQDYRRKNKEAGPLQYIEYEETDGVKKKNFGAVEVWRLKKISMGRYDSGGPVVRETLDGTKRVVSAICQGLAMSYLMASTKVTSYLPIICELTGLCPDGEEELVKLQEMTIDESYFCPKEERWNGTLH